MIVTLTQAKNREGSREGKAKVTLGSTLGLPNMTY